MGMFDFLKKKKKKQDLPLPPPPSAPDMPNMMSDIEPIRAEQPEDFPTETGPMEAPTPNLPELPELPPFKPAMEKEVVYEEKITPAHEEIHHEIYEEPKEEMVQARVPNQVFVDVDDYKKIITDTNTIRAKLMNAESYAKSLTDIKNEEEKAFEKWRTQLENVEKKLNYVDQLIAKASR